MNEKVLKIREFNAYNMAPMYNNRKDPSQGGSKIVVIGKPGTGKSTLVKSLIYSKRNIFPMGMVCSGTEESNHFYAGDPDKNKPNRERGFFPPSFVFNDVNLDKIHDFVSRQKYAKQHLPENPWGVLVMDDCSMDKRIYNDPIFRGLFMNGRHWKMLYILALQYAMDIKRDIRGNIDYVFILREPNLNNRKTLWENYAGVIPDFKMFCDIMDKVTENYTALVIDNTKQSNNWEDCVYFYKPRVPPKDWKFGSKDFWSHHYARYDSKYTDRY